MNVETDLRVHVRQRDEKFAWELHRDGLVEPVRFSGPLYTSAEAARTGGENARLYHLVRSQRAEQRRRVGRGIRHTTMGRKKTLR
jgi:hypothetical protein